MTICTQSRRIKYFEAVLCFSVFSANRKRNGTRLLLTETEYIQFISRIPE